VLLPRGLGVIPLVALAPTNCVSSQRRNRNADERAIFEDQVVSFRALGQRRAARAIAAGEQQW